MDVETARWILDHPFGYPRADLDQAHAVIRRARRAALRRDFWLRVNAGVSLAILCFLAAAALGWGFGNG